MARETEDDITPLGNGEKFNPVAAAKMAAKILAVITPALIGTVSAYKTASSETQVRVQSSKNKSEAGYQVTRQAVEALEQRVLVLEERAHKAEMATARAKPPRPAHRGGLPAPPAPGPQALPAKQLPANLDVAERQVYNRAATQSSPPALMDAGTP